MAIIPEIAAQATTQGAMRVDPDPLTFDDLPDAARINEVRQESKSAVLMMDICLTATKPGKPHRKRGKRPDESDESETCDPSSVTCEKIGELMKTMWAREVKAIVMRKKTDLKCRATVKAEAWDRSRLMKLYAKQCGSLAWTRMVKLLKKQCQICGISFIDK